MTISRAATVLSILGATALCGCSLRDMPVIDAHGPIALAERDLLFIVTGLVMLVVIPVFILTALFVWRYRASNPRGRYTPDWSYSGPLDTVIWLVPALIVSVIGYLTWDYTHRLDPYRPIGAAPLEIEVIAQDWKWLFIYPAQNIAVVNELVFPSERPVLLKITSDTVMNAIYIPGLSGQIYAMAGMRTDLNFSATGPAEFIGRNVQLSGHGFPDQQFDVRATTQTDFDAWVAQARRSSNTLDTAAYAALAKASRKVPVTFYSSVEPNLFARTIEKYSGPGMHRAHQAGREGVH